MAFALKASNCATVVKSTAVSRRAVVAVKAQKADAPAEVSRRAALGLFGAAAAAVAAAGSPAPALAAYGDAANVFGRVTNKSGFVPYAGEGFAVLLPSKWNPSKEKDFGGFAETVLRYEDNFDAVNNLMVLTQPTGAKSVEDLGSPEKLLESLSFLFGKQTFAGKTQSEGGFAPDRVGAASLLGVSTIKDKKGKPYYRYEILTRTADGDEGGRHQLITAGVAGGKLWILKVQVGDKRWFKGVDKEAIGTSDSFTLA